MLIQTEGGNGTIGKGDRRQNQNRRIYEAQKDKAEEEDISRMEKEAAIKEKKKYDGNEAEDAVRKMELSDHNPYVFNKMLFWNIQREEDIPIGEEDITIGPKEQIERNRSERYRKIINYIKKLTRENKNITVIGLQECHESLEINGFTRINFAPKASTIIVGDWENIDDYGNSLFIKNGSIELNLKKEAGNHNYEQPLSDCNSGSLFRILGNRDPREDELNNGKRVTNYFNYVFTDKTLYVNIHGIPQYYDLKDLFTKILNINEEYETGTLQNIYIGGDFNKTSDGLSEEMLSLHVSNFSQLIKYFTYKGVIYSESTRKGGIIDHIIQFTLKPIEAIVLNHNKATGICTILFNSGKWAYAKCDKATLEQTIPDETKYQEVLDQSNNSLPGTYLKYQTRVTVRYDDESRNYIILSAMPS